MCSHDTSMSPLGQSTTPLNPDSTHAVAICINATHGDDQKDVVGLVLLGGGLAGHGDHPVQEGGEVRGAIQLHLADGKLVGS